MKLASVPKRRGIVVHRLVWMAGTLALVPDGFEIHHRDENPLNNAFANLLCLHRLDHLKFHADEFDDTPF